MSTLGRRWGTATPGTGDHPTSRTFVDQRSQDRFEEQGWVVLPLLDATETARLRREVLALVPADRHVMGLTDDTTRRLTDELVRSAVAERAREVFVDHDLFLGTLFVKRPGSDGEKPLHCDWTFVDETIHTSGVVWVALDETDARSGGLTAVPGSHRLDIPPRGSPDLHFDIAGTEAGGLLREAAVDIAVPAGSAAVFDHRLIHGGGPNLGARDRVAVGLGFKPRTADLVHHRLFVDGTIRRYVVDEDFFLHFSPDADPPPSTVRAVDDTREIPRQLSTTAVATLVADLGHTRPE